MKSKEIIGREIIDANGITVGFVEELDINPRGKVIKVIGLPKGIVDRATRAKLELSFDDIEAFGDVIMLKKTKDEL